MATGPEHRALVQSARSLAAVVDRHEANDHFDDRVWREYRLALRRLDEVTADDAGGSDSLDELAARLRASVSDSEDA